MVISSYNISKQLISFSWAYIILFGIFFGFVPIVFSQSDLKDASFSLAGITIISVFGYIFGLNLGSNREIVIPKVVLKYKSFSIFIFLLYILTIAIIIISAGKIPLIESIKGTNQEELFILRETFLKKREGWEAYLSYAITLIDSAVFPYIIIFAFNIKDRFRFLYLGSFFLYSLSFLEKGYFFKIALPVFFYFFYISKNKKTFLIKGTLVLVFIIFGMFAVSRFDVQEVVRDDPFFSILYTPKDISSALIWRSIAVPVVTAIQGINLFQQEFHSSFFYGSTSSFISFIFGLERSNFERILYQSQFGGSETGNANQCYLVEAFINFGYTGVLLFSFFTGKLIRGIIKSNDIAALCIMPLFLYNLFNTGLIGNLLSNGFILFFLMMKFIKIKHCQ